MRAQAVPPAGHAHPQALGVVVRRALARRQQRAAHLHSTPQCQSPQARQLLGIAQPAHWPWGWHANNNKYTNLENC